MRAFPCIGFLLVLLATAPISAAAPLSLTDQQQQKLSALETDSRNQADRLKGQIDQLRRRLAGLYGTYNLDAGGARRLNRDLNRVQGQLLDLRLSEQQHLRAILSPDQFARLQAAIRQDDASKDRRRDEDFHDDHHRDDPDQGHGDRPWSKH